MQSILSSATEKPKSIRTEKRQLDLEINRLLVILEREIRLEVRWQGDKRKGSRGISEFK